MTLKIVRQQISAGVDGGLSGGSSVRRPGSELNLTYSFQTKKNIDPLKYYVKIDDKVKNKGKTMFFPLIQLQITC